MLDTPEDIQLKTKFKHMMGIYAYINIYLINYMQSDEFKSG